MMHIRRLLILAFLLIATPVFGANYCVTQDGTGTCGAVAATHTVSAFNALSGTGYAGDTFYFSGTFTSQVYPKISGTSGSLVTLDGYQAGTYDATDGNHTNLASLAKLTYNSDSGAMRLYSNDYMIIQDFNFDGGGSDSYGLHIYGTSTNMATWITVQNIYVHEYLNMGFLTESASGSPGIKYLTLQNSEFYDIGSATDPPSAGHSVRFVHTEEVLCQYNKVWSNDSTRAYGTGAITWGTTVSQNKKMLIQYNFAGYQNYDVPQPYGDGKGEGGIGGKGGTDVIVRYNKAYYNVDQYSGVGVGAGYDKLRQYTYCNWFDTCWNGAITSTGDPLRASNGVDALYIYYFSNIIKSSIDSGIQIAPYTGTDFARYIWIFNNTIYGNATDPYPVSDGSGIRVVNSKVEDVTIKNNILLNNRPTQGDYIQIKLDGDNAVAETTMTHNRFYHSSGTAKVYYGSSGAVTASTVGSNNTVGDPGLTAPESGDFTIASGSAVYGGGTDLRSSNLAYIVIMGTTYTIRGDEGLTDGTDFSGTDPTLWTVNVANRDEVGRWDQGAFIYGLSASETDSPTPDPATFASAPAGDSTTTISMTATTASDVTPPISYSFDSTASCDGCAVPDAGCTDSGWQAADTTYTDSGLSINSCCCYTVQTKDSLENTGTASAASHHHTWAATPGASTLGNAADTTLDIEEVDENSNTAGTWIAIQCTGTSPADTDWNNKWVDTTTGGPSASESWQAFETWDATETVTGLETDTTYCFKAKAVNAAAVETDLGAEVCLKTTGVFISPPEVTIDGGAWTGTFN